MPRSFALLLVGSLLATASLRAQTVDPAVRTEVLATLDRFTTALRAKDSAGMAAVLHPAARMTLLRPVTASGDSVRVVVLSGTQFIGVATAAAQPPLDEPIRNPQVTVHQHLATVWAEYQVRIDGNVSHCGYDAFQLVRTTEGWRLLNVADTFRRSDCGPMW